MPIPSIGRIVHLRLDGQTVAAIITGVRADGSTVDLTAFPPGTHTRHVDAVPHWLIGDEGKQPDGTWEWPPRVAPEEDVHILTAAGDGVSGTNGVQDAPATKKKR